MEQSLCQAVVQQRRPEMSRRGEQNRDRKVLLVLEPNPIDRRYGGMGCAHTVVKGKSWR